MSSVAQYIDQAWSGSDATSQGNAKKQILFTQETVSRDFTSNLDKPLWPLSSYGAAKNLPNVVSNQDESPEELRVKAVLALRSGAVMEYQNYEAEKIASANQLYANALANVSQVLQQAYNLTPDAAPVPNSGSAFGSASNPVSTFGSGSTGSTFGKPSAFGVSGGGTQSAFGSGNSVFGSSSTPSAFGKPAFGQSVFGQPQSQPTSAFAASNTSVFGQPQSQPTSAFAAPASNTSVFGQTSTPSVFGQPQSTSAFGQTQQPQSSLIKPATTGAFGSFGTTSAPSAFGTFGGGSATSNTAGASGSAFGSGGSNTAVGTGGGFSAFAGTGGASFGSAAGGNSVFGQPTFGTSNNAGTAPTSAFSGTGASGQPSAFGTAPSSNTISAFAPATSNTSSAFASTSSGQPVSAFAPTNTGSVFGSGGSAFGTNSSNNVQSAFGQAAQPTSAFAPSQAGSVFGQPSTSSFSAFGSSSATPSAFGATPSAAQQKPGPPDFEKALATCKPVPGQDKYDQMLPDNYLEILPAAAREAFESARFEWGKIPDLIPPVQLR